MTSLKKMKRPNNLIAPENDTVAPLEAVNENSVEESEARYSQDTIQMPGSKDANGTQVSSMIRKNQNDSSRDDKHATLIFAGPYDDEDGQEPERRLEAVDEMESSEGGVSEGKDGQ